MKRKRAFTLIELLAVVVIIGLVAIVALPAILPAVAHRSVSEAARAVQGGLTGARDRAMTTGWAGLRFLHDPASPLTSRRWVPLEQPPDYASGLASTHQPLPNGFLGVPALVVEQCAGSWIASAGVYVFQQNELTSWYWNIRLGDKITLGGHDYWVVGPTVQSPASSPATNPELFLNVGDPFTASPLQRTYTSPAGDQVTVAVEYLMVVNGRDDNANGWIDEGFDGIDNDLDGVVDNAGEWEPEAWQNPPLVNAPYTITRRPVPGPAARAVDLPAGAMIDLSRSSLPGAISLYTGDVDLTVNARGEWRAPLIYSTPASQGLTAAWFQFWIGESADIGASPPKGLWWIASVNARTGKILVDQYPDPATALAQARLQ